MLPTHLKKTVAAYESQLNTYIQYVWDIIPQFELAKFIGALPKRARILDIGCGVGRDVNYFAREGARVIGLDASMKLVQTADRLSYKRGRLLVRANALKLPVKNDAFDGIWCLGTAGHCKPKEAKQLLKQCFGALKKRGILCIDVPVGKGAHWVKSSEVNMLARYLVFWNQFAWESMVKEAGFGYMSSYELVLDDEFVWLVTFAKKL